MVVPAAVAAVLKGDRALVAPAVEAFFYRDMDDIRAARAMRRLPPKVRGFC